MENITKILMKCIRSEVFSDNANIPDSLTEEEINSLYVLSKKHDLAHIVASFLEKRGLIDNATVGQQFAKQKFLSVYRREQLDFEEERVCKLFYDEQIEFIRLKGAVMKKLYPQIWMRTSSDVDILIKAQDRDKAVSLLVSKFGYILDSDAERDCSLISKSGMNLELHFGITSNDDKLDVILKRVWDFAYRINEHEFALKDEFFIAYHIAHMQLHFTEGGCGVRPFIDLWLYKQNLEKCESEVISLLTESKSVDFYKGVKSLCEVWFGDKEHSELTELVENFVISGGVYGTRENLGATGTHKNGSYFKYLLNRIFMPKNKLRLIYPKIDKYPILIPYYQIKRWFNLLDKDVRKSAKNELSGNKNSNLTDKMLDGLGL
ncbi:MAG: nucleotidyltransferase family protein [Clostridia bacterium]|nr:nucleotidyltransferase family protein [Clostridia bacterium]